MHDVGITSEGDTTIYNEKGKMADILVNEICREEMRAELRARMGSSDNQRMHLLNQLLFEIDMSDIDVFKTVLYDYGACLTEKNYLGRLFFEQTARFVWQVELGRQSVEETRLR